MLKINTRKPGDESMYTCRGTIIYLSEEQIINDSLSKKVLAVHTEDDDRPQDLSFELLGKTMEMADPLQVGDRVSVTFFIRGIKSEKGGGTYFFNSLRPTRISKSKKQKEESEELAE
ncbi:MAG TPA: DUF3127 domain-containing protein [Bacteroidia bacterium]|jgi:hypothetical protein|nr:DUF3127 domain-containing protein [Bacteroidia bacterium]